MIPIHSQDHLDNLARQGTPARKIISGIHVGWMIKEGHGYIGQVDGTPRTVRFTHISGKTCDWSFPSPKVAREFIRLLVAAPKHTARPENMPGPAGW